MTKTGIEDACEAALGTATGGRAQGDAALARAIGVKRQAVRKWRLRGFVPPERAVEIEASTGVPARRLVDPRIVEIASQPFEEE